MCPRPEPAARWRERAFPVWNQQDVEASRPVTRAVRLRSIVESDAEAMNGGGRLRYFVASSLKPQLLHPATQRVRMHVQDPRGPVRPFHGSVGMRQYRVDVASLALLERHQR